MKTATFVTSRNNETADQRVYELTPTFNGIKYLVISFAKKRLYVDSDIIVGGLLEDNTPVDVSRQSYSDITHEDILEAHGYKLSFPTLN